MTIDPRKHRITCPACRERLASPDAPCRCRRAGATPPASPPPEVRATKRARGGGAGEAAMLDALLADGWRRDVDFVREYAWAVDQGRAYRADFAFLGGAALLLEVEGGAHALKRQHRDDCERASLAAALGYRVLRVHRSMIDDGTAIQFVRRAIACAGAVQ